LLVVDGVGLILIDTAKEREIEVGRNYNFNAMRQQQCIMH